MNCTDATFSNNGFVDDNGDECEKTASSEEIWKAQDENGDPIADCEYDPYLHRTVEHPLTNTETLLHLLKIALGTGIFAMPKAFSNSGYVVGTVGTIVVGIITTYCVHVLVKIHYILCQRTKVSSLSYPLIAEAAVLSGPPCFRNFGPFMIQLVNVIFLICEIGACCIYVVFISSNVKELTDYFFTLDTDVRWIMLILLLPLIFINWIRNLKFLAPLSIIGTAVTLISFGIIFYYLFREPLSLDGREAFGSISHFPMFFGTALFSLEAVTAIIPLENEMRSPEKFVGATGILNRAMVIVVSFFVGMGLCGYLKYGNDIEASITLNLPKHELPAQIAKALLSCAIFISNAVVTQVAIDLAWTQYFVHRLANSTKKLVWEYALRTSIVCVTVMLAIAIPNLDLFISLIGALTLSTLGLTLPAFLECCTLWHSTSGTSRALLIKIVQSEEQ
ncbi:hypothetical protein HA402_012995 [Bradysia odoriphaga]|nr:hypothetical protein HA402_012995 [Bradysia odoriphaga]